VKISQVRSNHARADELERLPLDEEDADEASGDGIEGAEEGEDDESSERASRPARERLGSRDNFWGS
jgi:hypothetical protein